MIPGDLLSACPNRQFHTLPGLLDSPVALSNSNPNALRAMQGGSLYHFYDGLWYELAGSRLFLFLSRPHYDDSRIAEREREREIGLKFIFEKRTWQNTT